MPFPVVAVLAALPIIMPAVVSVVQTVEGLFGGGKGDKKKDVVLQILLDLIGAYEGLKDEDIVDEEALVTALGKIVDGVVDALNEAGVLKS